jgi:hypothetical protein
MKTERPAKNVYEKKFDKQAAKETAKQVAKAEKYNRQHRLNGY